MPQSAGLRVSALMEEKIVATEMVMAKGRYIRPDQTRHHQWSVMNTAKEHQGRGDDGATHLVHRLGHRLLGW